MAQGRRPLCPVTETFTGPLQNAAARHNIQPRRRPPAVDPVTLRYAWRRLRQRPPERANGYAYEPPPSVLKARQGSARRPARLCAPVCGRSCVCVCMCAWACVRVRVRVRVRACIRVRVRACVCVRARACACCSFRCGLMLSQAVGGSDVRGTKGNLSTSGSAGTKGTLSTHGSAGADLVPRGRAACATRLRLHDQRRGGACRGSPVR